MKPRTRLHMPKTTVFPFNLWVHTQSGENLFHLDPMDLLVFACICQEANK